VVPWMLGLLLVHWLFFFLAYSVQTCKGYCCGAASAPLNLEPQASTRVVCTCCDSHAVVCDSEIFLRDCLWLQTPLGVNSLSPSRAIGSEKEDEAQWPRY
jgi:hypothetical protein